MISSLIVVRRDQIGNQQPLVSYGLANRGKQTNDKLLTKKYENKHTNKGVNKKLKRIKHTHTFKPSVKAKEL